MSGRLVASGPAGYTVAAVKRRSGSAKNEGGADEMQWIRGGWYWERRQVRVGALLAISLLLQLPAACLSPRVNDLKEFETIAMNRVVPYPDAGELQERTVQLTVEHRPSPPELDEEQLREARAWVRLAVENLALEQGARIEADPWEDPDAVGSTFGERKLSGPERAFTVSTWFSTYRYSVIWKRPFKFLWQTEAEVAGKPGSCVHRADLALELRVEGPSEAERGSRTFALEHSAQEAVSGLDPDCPYSESARSALFEKAMDEALGCLRDPLAPLFAPRGHVTAHIRAPDSGRHLFRISLGEVQGVQVGQTFEIRREQRSATPEGILTRTERLIAVGVVSDQIDEQSSWIAVDPSEASEPILSGDVVRPKQEQGLLASLSGPPCRRILSEP